jgi:thiazole synthase
MGSAFKAAVEAGRAAYEIGIAESSEEANATSPLTTFLYQN